MYIYIISRDVLQINEKEKPRRLYPASFWGGYLAELEASLFSEGLHTLGEKPTSNEMKGGAGNARRRKHAADFTLGHLSSVFVPIFLDNQGISWVS